MKHLLGGLLLLGLVGCAPSELAQQCDQGQLSACISYQDALARRRDWAQNIRTYSWQEPWDRDDYWR